MSSMTGHRCVGREHGLWGQEHRRIVVGMVCFAECSWGVLSLMRHFHMVL